MALNWTMLDPQRNPVPLPHETTLVTIDNGAEVSLTIPNALPSGSSAAGGSGGVKKLKGTGKIMLTDQRLLFISPRETPELGTLSVPLSSIISTSFEQPLFGNNYLSFEIKPAADGGLTHGTKAEVRLQDKGIFQFVSMLEKTRERAIYMKRQQEAEEDTLPLYETPVGDDRSVNEAGPSRPVSRAVAEEDIPRENPPVYTG